jgi:hypothetical protein
MPHANDTSPSQFRPFSVSYRYDGKQWCFDIQATSHEDAEARVKALAWAKVDGEIMERIPAVTGAGWYARLRCWWGNLRA